MGGTLFWAWAGCGAPGILRLLGSLGPKVGRVGAWFIVALALWLFGAALASLPEVCGCAWMALRAALRLGGCGGGQPPIHLQLSAAQSLTKRVI
jgi:hypothetical protein